MEYIGLIFEVLFLILGVYVYLFALGMAPGFGKPDRLGKEAEAFRQRNAWWLRLAALALIAISVVNLYLHLTQLLGNP